MPELERDGHPDFVVQLENFEGPFDLLLSLIGKHELDVVEVSLTQVTTEFIEVVAHLEASGRIEQISEFLVVAATLLDLKIASLLPRGEAVDAEEIALLEARDLLFARLLQYRAFKRASQWFAERLDAEEQRHARSVPLPSRYRTLAPEWEWSVTPAELAGLALVALTPREPLTVGTGHLHAPAVSIREQAALVVSRLSREHSLSFAELVRDAAGRGEIVARFLALLELYRSQAVAFEQVEPLGPLQVRWVAVRWNDETLATLGAEYDQ